MATMKFPDKHLDLDVTVARGVLRKARGLAFRHMMPADGMLFQFKRGASPRMWMWGMRFPVDIIWMNEGRVVKRVEHCSSPRFPLLSAVFPFTLTLYSCDETVDAVLEVPAGFCATHGIDIGERVEYVAG